MTAWQRLGIGRTGDVGEIRRAYARALKAIDPETDPESFIRLREALETALAQAARAAETRPEIEPFAPEPQPEAPERVEPVPDLPRLDEAPLQRIQAILFGESAEDAPEALAEATEALLADPALEQVELSRQIEALLAQWIIQGSPRSDPMLDPAIAFFGWDDPAGELRRPPAIGWILQRRVDRAFEHELLATNSRGLGTLLRSLRAPPAPIGTRAAWRLAPRVHYLITWCRKRHPTVLAGLDQDNLREWEERFALLRSGGGIAGALARARRRHLGEPGFIPYVRPFSWRLWVGIVIAPWLFAWFLLRRGHRAWERIVGLGWAAVVLLSLLGDVGTDPAALDGSLPPIHAAYVTPQGDIDPLLATMAPGKLTLAELTKRNPSLAAKLVGMWHTAVENGTAIADFESAAAQLLDWSYRAALHDGNDALQAAYWRVEAEKLRAVQTLGPSACDAYVGAAAHPAWSDRIRADSAAMVAEALAAGPTDPPAPPSAPPGTRRTFAIPGPIFTAAAKRAGLEDKGMAAALRDGGSRAERCAARIALIEEALAQPKNGGSQLLRRMSAGL